MFQVACPHCKDLLQFPDADRGTVVACSGCGQQMRLPAAVSNGLFDDDFGPRDAPPRDLGPESDFMAAPPPEPRRPPRDLPGVTPAPDRPYLIKFPEGADTPDVREALDRLSPATAQQLGPLTAVYRASKSHHVGQIIVFGIVCALGLFVIGLGIYLAAHVKGAAAALLGLLVLTTCGAGIIALGIFMIVRVARAMRQLILVFPDGLVHARTHSTRIFCWDEITALWQHITKHYYNGAYTGTTHVYTLLTEDREKVVFNDAIKDVEALGDVIANEITRRRLPQAITDFNAGEMIRFGKLGVSQEGVSYGGSLLPWHEVDAVRVEAGWISVGKKGKWFNWCKIAAASVPNLFVFLALVDEIVGIGRK